MIPLTNTIARKLRYVCKACGHHTYRVPKNAHLPCSKCQCEMHHLVAFDKGSRWKLILDDGSNTIMSARKLQALAIARGLMWTCVYARLKKGHRSLTKLLAPSKKTGRPLNTAKSDNVRGMIRLLMANRALTIADAAKSLGLAEKTMSYKLADRRTNIRSLPIQVVDIETMVRVWRLEGEEAQQLRILGAREAGWRI